MTRHGSNFADVDFGIEVCGKRLTMVPAIAVENIKRVDAVEVMFFQVGCKNAGHAGIKTRTQQCRKASVLVTVLIGPLPMIFEFGDIKWFVVRRVHIMNASSQTRIHDVEVLVRQSKVDDQAWLDLVQQRSCRGNIIGIK